MESNKVQNIIDHWHLGRLKGYKLLPGLIKAKTNKGQFIIVELSDREWQSGAVEDVIEVILTQIKRGSLERLVSPLFAHIDRYHYCLYQKK